MVSKYSVTIRKHHGYSKPQKSFVYHGHQGKERAYVQALRKAGYQPSIQELRHGLKFAIYDMDGNWRLARLERYYKRGLPVFLYPHAARPQVIWDGIWDAWSHITCNFVPSEGHKEVMRRYGYEIPIEVTGWTYCDILPFQPVEKPMNILFGPIHPAISGWICDEDKDANKRTYKVLMDYCHETGAHLTVRYIRDLKENGLERIAGVTYIPGRPDLTIDEIDRADVVIGHQTFAYLAIARGKPTLMMREDLPPHTVWQGETRWVKSWDKYADIMAYPLDILSGDPAKNIKLACSGTENTIAWRDRFINKMFDPKEFVDKLERYL